MANTTYARSCNNVLLTAPGKITVTQIFASVPESATWAMKLIGFGAVGFVMRWRGKVSIRICFACHHRRRNSHVIADAAPGA